MRACCWWNFQINKNVDRSNFLYKPICEWSFMMQTYTSMICLPWFQHHRWCFILVQQLRQEQDMPAGVGGQEIARDEWCSRHCTYLLTFIMHMYSTIRSAEWGAPFGSSIIDTNDHHHRFHHRRRCPIVVVVITTRLSSRCCMSSLSSFASLITTYTRHIPCCKSMSNVGHFLRSLVEFFWKITGRIFDWIGLSPRIRSQECWAIEHEFDDEFKHWLK